MKTLDEIEGLLGREIIQNKHRINFKEAGIHGIEDFERKIKDWRKLSKDSKGAIFGILSKDLQFKRLLE